MKIADFKSVRWSLHPDNPILSPPRFSPLVADPSLLLPHESPDERFHLFVHSLFGIHEYHSGDGVAWEGGGLLFRHGMRPFVFKSENRFCLLYERYVPFQIAFSWLTAWKWNSRIEMRTSEDLRSWSSPITLLEPSLDWHKSRYGRAVGNPCLVKTSSGFRLYFSASLVYVKDCGFCEPEFIGAAEGHRIEGPYFPARDPVITPGAPYRNLAAGALKVLPMEDGFAGLENCISEEQGRSTSAVYLLGSSDGYSWEPLFTSPILSPSEGWMRSHVYAADARYIEKTGKWHMYFNARDDWHWTRGKEKIGLLIGQ